MGLAGQVVTEGGVIVSVGQAAGLDLAIKSNPKKTLGKVIIQPQSADLISGVVIEPLPLLADDRGYFTELARLGRAGIAQGMTATGGRQIQVSATMSYPGTIKAIHYHFRQTDLWAPLWGMMQVFLGDLRRGSPTFGLINTLYVGQLRPWEILIPPGVAHGYKVLGTEAAHLVYMTDHFYDPTDEGRLPHDHPDIAYDWEVQFK